MTVPPVIVNIPDWPTPPSPPSPPVAPPYPTSPPAAPPSPPSPPFPTAPPSPPSPPTLPPTLPPIQHVDRPPDLSGPEYLFDWRYSDACKRIENAFAGTITGPAPVVNVDQIKDSTIGSVINWFTSAINSQAETAAQAAIEDATPYVIGAAIDSVVAAGFKMVNIIFSQAFVTGSEHTDRLLKLGTSLSVSQWAERLTGAPMTYLNQDTLYAFRYTSPQFIPGQGELDDLYIRSVIDRDTYVCMTRAHGNIPTWRLAITDANQLRPSPVDLHKLYDRGVISDVDWSERMERWGYKDVTDRSLSYDVSAQTLDIRSALDAERREIVPRAYSEQLVRGAGWRDPVQVDVFRSLMSFIPPYSDVIRMMVHDVEDPTVVSDYELDTDFGKKYAGQLQKWGEHQGIPTNAALYMWRSHWNYPSDTQTYQFLHRLRIDRPERVEWEKDNPQEAWETPYQYRQRGPIAFTVEDAKRLLSVNDMAPTFIGAEIAISYNPITRTDAIRAFEIGVYDEAQLKWNFIFNGYNDNDAQSLVEFEREQKSRRVANATGVMTIRKIVKFYKGGAINRGRAEVLLRPLMTNPVDRQTILDRSDEEMTAETRTMRIANIRKRFLVGETNAQQVTQSLLDTGLDQFTADELASKWVFELANRRREPTAAMLCKWYNHGLIADADYILRLQRIGYSFDDSSRIARICIQDLLKKQQDAAARSAEKGRKELEKMLKSQYELEKANKAKLEKNIEKLHKELEKVQKELDKRIAAETGQNGQPH